MKINQNKLYAVLTGDVIKSSKLSSEDRQILFRKIQETVDILPDIYPPMEYIGVDIYRGDGWQLLISNPEIALNVSLYLRANLKTELLGDTRIAIGIGTVEAVPDNSLSQSSGSAFLTSGKLMDKFKIFEHMGFAFADDILEKCLPDILELSWLVKFINTSILFISRFADDWNFNEARAISGALRGLKQEDIGKLWPEAITQQSVAGTLRRAGWHEILKSLKLFEEVIEVLKNGIKSNNNL